MTLLYLAQTKLCISTVTLAAFQWQVPLDATDREKQAMGVRTKRKI